MTLRHRSRTRSAALTAIPALALGASLVLGACGPGEGPSGNGDADGGSEGSGGELKIAHYFAAGHHQNVALEEVFKPMVEENTDITVEIFPNNELGGEEQYTNSLRSGSVEMAVAGMALQNAAPLIGITEWPFLFEGWEHAQEVLHGEIGDEIAAEFEPLGVTPLAWTANGFRAVSANRPIESMDDFRGLRLRFPDIPIYISMGEALGASVQPMSIDEIFTALEQGVIDGQDNPIATLRASGWYEVQSHVLDSAHMFSPNVYLINTDFWESLSEEDRGAIQEAADAASERQWDLAQESVEDDRAYLEEEGITFVTPDDDFRQEMIAAMDPVYERLYSQYDWAQEYQERILNADNE